MRGSERVRCVGTDDAACHRPPRSAEQSQLQWGPRQSQHCQQVAAMTLGAMDQRMGADIEQQQGRQSGICRTHQDIQNLAKAAQVAGAALDDADK